MTETTTHTDSSPNTDAHRVVDDGTEEGELGFTGLILDLEPNDGDTTTKRPVCNCGCGRRTNSPKSVFIQGHDQALKGKLIRAGRAGEEVTILQGGMAISGEARTMVTHLLAAGGIDQVLAGIERPAKPTRRPAERGAIRGTVKVGRWEYPALKLANGEVKRALKRDGSGEWVLDSLKIGATFTPAA